MKKKKQCKKGYSCGASCISLTKACRKEFSEGASASLESRNPNRLPEGEELVRLSREWTEGMGLVNSHDKYQENPSRYIAYHDDQHILLHRLLGKDSKALNPAGKNSVSFKEEAMVEFLNFEYSVWRDRDSAFPTPNGREDREKVVNRWLSEMYQDALDMGFTKTAEYYAADKRDSMTKEIVDLFDNIDPVQKEQAMRIIDRMKAGDYNFSEDETIRKRRNLFYERMIQNGDQ